VGRRFEKVLGSRGPKIADLHGGERNVTAKGKGASERFWDGGMLLARRTALSVCSMRKSSWHQTRLSTEQATTRVLPAADRLCEILHTRDNPAVVSIGVLGV
jgi:hypothetical protein